MKELTKKQKLFWSIMRTNSGVLHILGKPGISKSSQCETIAKKLGYQYMDIRLSMVDETEVGLYPYRKTIDGQETLSYAVPEWAILANKQPTIVNFDEMKRASLAVRNAALQILLERRIGPFFKFNNNVHFVITDNLGREDGTDVDQFDAALNNRLIHYEFNLTFDEWVQDFAGERIVPEILKFLEKNLEYFYHRSDKGEKSAAYATPRSWTFLSDWIKTNITEDMSREEKLNLLSQVAPCYIGSAAVKFIDFLATEKELTLEDICKARGAKQIETMLKEYNRDKKSELVKSIQDAGDELFKRPKKELQNIGRFFAQCDLDEIFETIFRFMLNRVMGTNTAEGSGIIVDTLFNEYPEFYKQLEKVIENIGADAKN